MPRGNPLRLPCITWVTRVYPQEAHPKTSRLARATARDCPYVRVGYKKPHGAQGKSCTGNPLRSPCITWVTSVYPQEAHPKPSRLARATARDCAYIWSFHKILPTQKKIFFNSLQFELIIFIHLHSNSHIALLTRLHLEEL